MVSRVTLFRRASHTLFRWIEMTRRCRYIGRQRPRHGICRYLKTVHGRIREGHLRTRFYGMKVLSPLSFCST